MNHELDRLRRRFAWLLVMLMWLHVPVLGFTAFLSKTLSVPAAMMAGAILAAIYHMTWFRNGTAPVTRYVSAIVLIGEPALLLLLLKGHAWQMDMHMYFFAMIALNIAWFDRYALLIAATATALHHLVLLYFIPVAVFTSEGNLPRVMLHALIVAIQTSVLIWVSDKIVDSFQRMGKMSIALEERTHDAEQANRTKSMFLANMSHEIRTPINAILGFCHLVQRTMLDPHQRDYVSKINVAGVSLLRLINDILDFSKNEAGKLSLDERVFNLREAISCQIQLVAETASAKDLRITLMVCEDVPATLIGDDMRFNQVLLNLLGNAIKFTERGTIFVKAELTAQADGRAEIEVSVRDTGIGMTEEQLGRLFSPFAQADSTTTRRFGGTGLGLVICRQIVEQMGGWITAISEPDRGSEFTFMVNLGIGHAVALAEIEPIDATQRMRVLIADDNVIAREMILDIFQAWDMAADVASSGAEALEMLRVQARADQPYDLVMIDWKMPDMDGVETLRKMRDDPAYSATPHGILMTAYSLDDLIQEGGYDPEVRLLSKPINRQNLAEMLNSISLNGNNHDPNGRMITQAALRLPVDLQQLRVLLVEDNEINRQIAAELLTDAGLQVDCAHDGAMACDMVAQNASAYAAILMDVQMPVMDGMTATRQIRLSCPPTTLPIIAMTAHVYPEERRACFDAGMNDHVAKPIDPAVLLDTLARCLRAAGHTQKPVAAKPVEIAPVAAGLPDLLPPFDLPAALRRMNGKSALLRRLIIAFGDSHHSTCAELSALLKADKLKDAHRIAHTLKGVAASLELASVAKMAGRIEDLLADHQVKRGADLIAALAVEVDIAVTAARSLTQDQPAVTETDASSLMVADEGDVAMQLELLRDQIRRRSISARQGFQDLADLLDLGARARAAHPVHLALQRLDYATAQTMLDTAFPDPSSDNQGLSA